MQIPGDTVTFIVLYLKCQTWNVEEPKFASKTFNLDFAFLGSYDIIQNLKKEMIFFSFFQFVVLWLVVLENYWKAKVKSKKKKRKNFKQKHCMKGVHLELFCFKFYLNVCYQLNLISEFRCAMLYATKCEMQIPTKWLEFSDFENSDFPKN